MADDIERTLEFFARWGVSHDEMVQSFRDSMAPGCVWDQRPMARTTGPDEAVGFLRLSRRSLGLETADIDVPSIAAADGAVHSERIDHLRRADGSLIGSVAVAGILRWENGRIVAWREYFDVASFAGRALPGVALHAAKRLVPLRG
jgi:limonene-1,2-epoxide hydrolase